MNEKESSARCGFALYLWHICDFLSNSGLASRWKVFCKLSDLLNGVAFKICPAPIPTWLETWQRLPNPKRLHVDKDGQATVMCGMCEYTYDCGPDTDFQAAIQAGGESEEEALKKAIFTLGKNKE